LLSGLIELIADLIKVTGSAATTAIER